MDAYRSLQGFERGQQFPENAFFSFYRVSSYRCLLSAGLSLKNKNRIRGVVKVCTKITATALKDTSGSYKVRVLATAHKILATHRCFGEFPLLPSSQRHTLPRCKTNRLKNSVLPVAPLNSTAVLNQFILNVFMNSVRLCLLVAQKKKMPPWG